MTLSFSQFINVRQAYAPSFSPDGARLAFLTNITGFPQVWSMPVEGGWPDQLTFGDDRVAEVAYSPKHSQLIFARDVGGNENTQLYRLNADGSGERRLTHDDGAMHNFGGWSPDGQQIAFTANRRQRGRYDLYLQAIASDEARLVWQNDTPGIVAPAGFSPDGLRVLVFFLHGSMNHDLYEVSLATGQARHLTPHTGDIRYGDPVYSADGQSVYCLCDRDREFMSVAQLNLADLTLTPVAQPEAEVEWLSLSPNGQTLVWAVNVDGGHILQGRHRLTGEALAPTNLPLGVVSPVFDSHPVFSPDSTRVAFSFSTPRRTPDVWLWELAANTVRPLTQSSHAGLPPEIFTEPQLIRYPTFDGREIPAWFYRPASGARPQPVIVYVHGGPEGQTQPFFYPVLQYFAAQGYAVLAPNVRGSSGYGKTYTHLDDVERRMDSVTDLAHAVDWLHRQSGIDPQRIAVYGGSYGGFMVLSAITTYPDRWAAAVDIVGISNFVTFLENTGAYRRSAREAEYGSLERDREFLTRVSPIHQVDKIKAPLMVIHGANDPRVPLSEAEQIVAALRARNVSVEFIVYPDEGHGIIKLANKLDVYPKIAAFLEQHLAV